MGANFLLAIIPTKKIDLQNKNAELRAKYVYGNSIILMIITILFSDRSTDSEVFLQD